jgi:hypothetical protein
MLWDNWQFWAGGSFMLFACAGWFVAARLLRERKRQPHMLTEDAKQLFHLRREWLEARFFSLASASGKPRGLSWVDCDFEDDVSFARDRVTGQLRAFSAVTIRFTAVEGGGMEENENVGRLRAATAVFLLDGSEWITQGRVIFNLSPEQTIEHFREELELVE